MKRQTISDPVRNAKIGIGFGGKNVFMELEIFTYKETLLVFLFFGLVFISYMFIWGVSPQNESKIYS